jgi:predicted nucleic acid-binding protein
MERALIDTNIVVDYLRGVTAARELVEQEPAPAISVITFMETLAGAAPHEASALRLFLAGFERIALGEAVIEESISQRRLHRLKLPDAIIWASARITNRTLVTRDLDLAKLDLHQIQVPYRI